MSVLPRCITEVCRKRRPRTRTSTRLRVLVFATYGRYRRTRRLTRMRRCVVAQQGPSVRSPFPVMPTQALGHVFGGLGLAAELLPAESSDVYDGIAHELCGFAFDGGGHYQDSQYRERGVGVGVWTNRNTPWPSRRYSHIASTLR